MKLKDGCSSIQVFLVTWNIVCTTVTFVAVKEINNFEKGNADVATGTNYFSFYAEKLKEHCKHSNTSYLIPSR